MHNERILPGQLWLEKESVRHDETGLRGMIVVIGTTSKHFVPAWRLFVINDPVFPTGMYQLTEPYIQTYYEKACDA